jgi:hypothetical protein
MTLASRTLISRTFASLVLPVALTCAVLGAAPSSAQQLKEPDVPSQPSAPKLDPKACADRERLPHADIPGTEGRAPESEEHLGDKLARTDGVICPPPGLDPDIRAPTPNGSNMPVIPPPGSPGGDPNVRPK